MADITVFYGQQIYGEYTKQEWWDIRPSIPDGSYIRNWCDNWYIKLCGGFTPINYSDIPKEVRLNCLLMGITI